MLCLGGYRGVNSRPWAQQTNVQKLSAKTTRLLRRPLERLFPLGGCHSSMVSSAPTILRPWVQIPSTPSTLFSIYIEIVIRKERK